MTETETSGSINEGVIVVKGDNVANVAMALSSPTRIQILNYIKGKEVDMQQIAELIKQSKANASAQMRILEGAGLVKTIYRPGVRGVKKVCTTNVKEVRLILD
ncbi:MAG: ArsR family transcriptional regulator [Candidatus Methanomethylicia archaeon]|jgi:predicted transcriptional regulator|uniref:ArsR family transcriptional regulator n=1 Tax=Thermoproteota archaeon TaxID=2056631 RepID=A0A523BFS5_9CREN|nr:ArsR family transcriptional regulator [Candidatus Methanomethylicia archaeon]MCQ5373894.1 ArsR family transcriptional regulator [Candidatus Methanomethylicia archaeon]NHV59896.1 winged helix-turn-helix transcriptional regulator [Candidatus Verstraetearchaeota archaeon]TDA39797.1 MAG: ArsR family transcriptional regulator [Candidatus Verstraetearchaeota archaeon]